MQVELKVPNNWETITLKNYLAYLKDVENYKDDEDAVTAVTLLHFCGLQPEWLNGINVSDLNLLKAKLNQFIGNQEHELQRKIYIDGQAYGFEPNLSSIAYGAYLDITKYDTFTIDENWAKIMSILYRPIIEEKEGMYLIKTYDGTDNSEKFLDLGMDIHFGSLFFFINLSMDLANATLKYSMEMDIPHDIKQILARSGELTQHLSHSHKITYSDLMKLLNSH
jgi:hypothetical protein